MDRAIAPGPAIDTMIRVLNDVFKDRYFLAFGALYGLIRNEGTIPDGDIDVCTYYGSDIAPIEAAFKRKGYHLSKCILSDTDGLPVYAGFNPNRWDGKHLHVCVLFMVECRGIYFWGHDRAQEMEGTGVPERFYLNAVDADHLEPHDHNFRMVEWPGIKQVNKVRIPLCSGRFLDDCYPLWHSRCQKYNIPHSGAVNSGGRTTCYHRGGAYTKYRVDVKSIKDLDTVEFDQDTYFKYVKSLDGRKT